MLAIVAALLMVVAGVVLAVQAVQVARRRRVPSGVSLAVVLAAVSWWGFTYAVELSSSDLAPRLLWGDLKYAGVALLAPAWLCFVLQYTGRERLVTRRLVLLLALEPVAVVVALLTPALHDLVRYYPDSAATEENPVVATGPLFWVHFAYVYAMVLVATSIFVVSLVRVSRVYWRMSAVLVAASLLPWVLNALHNLSVGPFVRLDLTPFAFIVTGGVLVWGLFRERLVKLTPVARGVVIETMSDAVMVLDAFGRIVDANPAAGEVFARPRDDLVGRRLAALLPAEAWAARTTRAADPPAQAQLALTVGGRVRHYDSRRQAVPDSRGATAGELVVLRDVTDRTTAERRMRELLAERTRVAAALQASLLPTRLPIIPGATLAGRYQPAGDGREIGGDFFDVFALQGGAWGIALGDVSGKGAEAAAVTAQVRYTLRTLAGPDRSPRDVLTDLNEVLLKEAGVERYCTLVYALARPTPQGLALTLCLGGHHPPLLLRAGQTAPEPVGRLGTALGLLEVPTLEDECVGLGPQDLLCLFTDGLVEARRGADLFDEAGAGEVLVSHRASTPSQLAAALEEAARQFRGGPLSDDLALLVLRVEDGRPAPPPDPDGLAAH